MYDKSEAALRRIVARAREGGPTGKAYVELAMLLMRSTPASPSRDRALKRLADSCDDAMSLTEKTRQSMRRTPPDAGSSCQTAR